MNTYERLAALPLSTETRSATLASQRRLDDLQLAESRDTLGRRLDVRG